MVSITSSFIHGLGETWKFMAACFFPMISYCGSLAKSTARSCVEKRRMHLALFLTD
jgi:hypothetical protein